MCKTGLRSAIAFLCLGEVGGNIFIVFILSLISINESQEDYYDLQKCYD